MRSAKSPGVRGSYTAEGALEALLAGTGFATTKDASGAFAVVKVGNGGVAETGSSLKQDADAVIDEQDAKGEAIVVTGSRIRGAPPAAPVITVTSDDIRNAGQSDLGEVARALPQNYGGGQNPGIGGGQGAPNANTNINSASTFNLRGMGPDATLTLLNGNRLSYSTVNSAIDISAIPTAAVKRVEILPDGASAIYGSDAVAGVANIILRRDYQGITTTARAGGSTEGGNEQAQISVTGGLRWGSGGFIAVYDYLHQDPIYAGDRHYTASMNPASFLYPEIRRHSALVSVHQDIIPSLTFAVDAAYKWGDGITIRRGNFSTGPIEANGSQVKNSFDTLVVAPTLTYDLSSDWTFRLAGTYGFDVSRSDTTYYSINPSTTRFRYANHSATAELSAEGSLVDLPGGQSRLAIGAGYRWNDFERVLATGTISPSRNNLYAYGELFIPLIAEAQHIPLVRELTATVAGRIEDYSGLESVTTPKIGLSYRPVNDLIFRLSWGKSFKTPTLLQQYLPYQTILRPVAGYGTTFPASATYIWAVDGNPALKPERSEGFTLSADYEPDWAAGLRLTASYYHTDYSSRVVLPVATTVGVLTNPIYAPFVTLNPTNEQINDLLAGAPAGLLNITGGPYNPGSVVAILDARNTNATSQTFEGADLSLSYAMDLGSGASLRLTGSAAYLKSKQILIQGTPAIDLAGDVFNPPHVRVRAGATWQTERFSLSAFANYTGGVEDARRTTSVDGKSFTTIDLTGRAHIGDSNELSLTVTNILNEEPSVIYTTAASDTPFDTTNYNALGRVLSISLTRHW